MDFADVRALARALPGVEDGTSYGTAALKIRGKLLARLKEDGETLVLCAVLSDERALLMEMAPEVFYFTEHYRGYPTVLVRLGAADAGQMDGLLRQSWRRLAPVRLVRAVEAGEGRE